MPRSPTRRYGRPLTESALQAHTAITGCSDCLSGLAAWDLTRGEATLWLDGRNRQIPARLVTGAGRRGGRSRPRLPPGREGRVDEYPGGRLGRGGGGRATVEPRLGEGSVVQQGELSRQAGRIRCTQRRRLLGHHPEQPRAGRARDFGSRAVRPRLGGGVSEGTAAELRLLHRGNEHIEHREQLPSRVIVQRHLGEHRRPARRVTRLEVGTHELLLAAERAVEAGLGDASPLDDRVDADSVDPVFVEQLAGRIEQPVPGRPAAAGAGAHTSNLTDRSVRRESLRDLGGAGATAARTGRGDQRAQTARILIATVRYRWPTAAQRTLAKQTGLFKSA